MKNKKNTGSASSKTREPIAGHGPGKQLITTKEFTYTDFKKIAARTDLTQKEWSDILHISERTLQRYAKENNSFSFSVTDRILQIDKVLKRGFEVFGSYGKFLRWLRDDAAMPEGRLFLHSLAGFEGINNILIQLGRIEHGILA